MGLLANAQKLPAKSAKGKVEVEKIATPGLDLYASIDALEKALKALKETARVEVDEAMRKHFAKHGPENYKGIDGKASASLELRKRSSASALNEAEQLMCSMHGISTEVVEDRPETYIIKPEHQAWLLKNEAKISAALTKLGAPEDLFQFQESTKKTVVTETSIDEIYKLNNPATIISLLPVVGTLAIKPKTEKKIEDVLAQVAEFLGE